MNSTTTTKAKSAVWQLIETVKKDIEAVLAVDETEHTYNVLKAKKGLLETFKRHGVELTEYQEDCLRITKPSSLEDAERAYEEACQKSDEILEGDLARAVETVNEAGIPIQGSMFA